MSSNTQTDILKRYYDMLYPEQLKENEYIALFFMKTDKNGNVVIDENNKKVEFHRFVKNFEEYQEYINKYRHNFHVYNALATVKPDADGELHRQESNMYQQKVLFIDFDKKDYPDLKNAHDFTKMIKEKLPNMFLHAYYDSGHGYHYYIIIPPTFKIRELCDFNKELCALVGADTNACKVTQVARIPCTFNHKYTDKNGAFPFAKEIDHYRKHPQQAAKFHPLNIENLKRAVNNVKKQFTTENIPELPLTEWKYDTGGFDVKLHNCLCTEKVFHEGADEHERNTWLGRIIVWLKGQRCMDYQIEQKCQEWNLRCRPPKSTAETQSEIEGWYEWISAHGMAVGGCWWNIKEERTSGIVRKQCDKFHCRQAINPYESMSISEDVGVKINQKVLTDSKLSIKGKNTMSGYEYLILTVLDKYMPKTGRTVFTIKDLKYRMQYKRSGKWQFCMDISTLKKTLEDLENHKCIKVTEPTQAQCKKKNPSFDDKVIKLTRGLKDVDMDKYIIFYYSVARAFICHQITQNEYKVYLCILNNLKDSKSCTLEKISITLDIKKGNILRAIQNLEIASLLRVDRLPPNANDKQHNMYYPTDTDRWNDVTNIELDKPDKSDDMVSGLNITLIA
ncbi:MAG: hypothetical protein K1W19_08095 [Lachnospiraceae bacterium]